MKKNNIVRKIGLSSVLLSALFMSCEVGLGSAIDTEPPVITITNPPADAVIASDFALMGTWSDDGYIDSVTVTLSNIDTKEKYGAYEAEFTEPDDDSDEELGSWRCLIKPKAPEFDIPDGNYEVTIEIKDQGEHTVKIYRNFAIDNTPPVVILERPGSIVGSGSIDTYGRNLTLEGMAADDHDVSHIEFYVYDTADFSNLLEKITVNNIPPTINIPIANFEPGVENAYSQIYKSTSILETPAQTRFCKIVAYDGAVKYPLDGSEPTEEDKKGNSIDYYYLKETLSTSGILTDDCKITDIYHILNGNKAAPSESFLSSLQTNQVNQGTFVINPKNNPSYTVSVRQALKKDGNDFDKTVTTDNVMYKGSPITVEVTAGLDNYGMKNLRPYAIECDAYGNVKNGAAAVYLGAASGDEPVTNYKWSVTLTDELGLVNDHCYVVLIEGTDIIGNDILPKDAGYGFYFDTKANVSIENLALKLNDGANIINDRPIYIPSKNPSNTANNTKVEVSGSVLSTSGKPYIYIYVEDIEVAAIPLTDAQKDPAWNAAENNGKYKYNFTAEFDTSKIPAAYADKEVTLAVTLINGSVSKTETKKAFYDCTAPEITTFALNPTAKKYNRNVENGPDPDYANISYLNGTVNFDYQVRNEGNQLAKVDVEIFKKKGDGWELIRPKAEFTSDFSNITLDPIDTAQKTDGTADIADGTEVKTVLSVWDKAGNKSERINLYTVDQTTDKPVILPADSNKSTLKIGGINKDDIKDSEKNPAVDTGEKDKDGNPIKKPKNYITTGFPLSLKAFDDDGIKEISIDVETLSNVKKTPGGVKEYDFDVTLPGKAGVYSVTVNVTDINDTSCDAYTFAVRVVTKNPIVTVTKDKNYVSTEENSTSKQIAATVNINSDQKPFTIERKVKDSKGNEKSDYYKKYTSDVENPTITDTIDEFGSKPLSSDVYTITYVVTDVAGETGEATDTFNVDNSKPVIDTGNISVPDPKAEKTGTIEDWKDKYINKNSGSFSGTAAKGSENWQSDIKTVEYSFDGTTYFVAGGTTGWQGSGDFTGWTEGKKKIWVRATDEVGNVSTPVTKEFWYDKAAPEAKITEYAADNGSKIDELGTSTNNSNAPFYYGKKFTLKGIATDTNPEALQSVILYQNTLEVPVTVKADGTWEVTGLPKKADGSDSGATAEEGVYVYKLYVKDACGKEIYSQSQTLKVDNKQPEKPVLDWIGSETPAGTANIVLKGTKFDIKATVKDSGYTGSAADACSGVKSITYKYYKGSETTPFAENTVNAADNVQDKQTKLLFEGTTGTSDINNLFEGEYKIEVTATDRAGNVSEPVEQKFFVDQAAPVIEVHHIAPVGKTELESNNKKIILTGTFVETNGIESLKVTCDTDGQKPEITRNDSAGTWKIEDDYKADGTIKYTFTAVDKAGRKTELKDEKAIVVVIDTAAPVVSDDPTKFTLPVVKEKHTEKASFHFAGAKDSITDGTNSSGLSNIIFVFSDADVEQMTDSKVNELTNNKGYDFTLNTSDGSWGSTQTFNNYKVFYDDSTTQKAKEGMKKLWLQASDKAGNKSEWKALSFDYDKAAPEIAETGLKTDGTYQNTKNPFALSGTASDGNGVKSVTAKAKHKTDSTKSKDLEITGTTSWSTTISKDLLADGEYDIEVTVTDNAGKTNSVIRNVIVDATAPTIKEVTQAEKVKTLDTGLKLYNTRTITLIVEPDTDVSGIESVSYTTVAYTGSKRPEGDWFDLIYQTSGDYKGKYTGSVTFENDGENKVYFRIIDNAQNVTGEEGTGYSEYNYQETIYNVDTTPPKNLKVYDAEGNEITDMEIVVPGAEMTGKKNLVFYVKADEPEGGAGVKGIVLGNNAAVRDDLETTTAGSITDTYEIEIPIASQKTGDIYFTASDKIGNKESYRQFSLTVDNEVPGITLTAPAFKSGSTEETDDLNGAITISGSVTDLLGASRGSNDGKVVSIKLEYSKTGTSDWKTIDDTDIKTSGLGNKTEYFTVTHKFSSFDELYNSALGKTTELSGAVWVKVTAEDEAGNKGDKTRKINLNRNSDRPVITFDSVNLTGMTAENAVWLKGTTLLSGTIEDDDGIEKMQIKSVETAGEHPVTSEWKDVTVNGTAWSYDLREFYAADDNQEENANIPRKIYFRVVDKENNKKNSSNEYEEYFESEESAGIHSVIIKGNDKKEFGSSGECTVLNLKVDTLAPAVTIKGIHLGAVSSDKTVSNESYSENYGALTLGGDSTREFYVKFSASDKNGIKSKVVKAKFDDYEIENDANGIVESTTENDTFIAKFTLNLADTHKKIDGKNGNLKISVEAEDEAGNKNPERFKNIAYDYKKPVITIKKPSATATSSGSLEVSGMVEDNASSPSLYYALSTSNTVSPGTGNTITTWTGTYLDPENNNSPVAQNETTQILGKARPVSIKPEYKRLNSNITWFLHFDGKTEYDNHDKLLNDIINDFGIASISEINTGTTRFATIVNLYLWVKAVDANGNTQEVCHPVKVDPQGMRPSLTIQSPVSGSKLGGTITVNGTAEPKGNNVMDVVYLQIGNADPIEIKTNGSTSWSTKINRDGSLNGAVTLTIWAADKNGNTSLKETCNINVDANSPVIESVFYRKRAGNTADGTITASKEYSSSAYISGQWFLEVKATDKNGDLDGSVQTLQLIDADTENVVTGADLIVSQDDVDPVTKMAVRTLQYKLPQNTGVGEKKYTISVSDGVTPATKEITVNYDNTDPVLQTAGKTNYNLSSTSIEQDNGFYKLGSQVFETPVNGANQSGLNFVAFYFKKNDTIYDVMRHRTTVQVKADEYVIDSNDGLPWKKYTISSKDHDSIVLQESLAHIYKGGLVKINDVIYEISEVTESSKEVAINGTLDLDERITYDYAYFALANVVNNTVQESEPDNPASDNQKIRDKTQYGYGYYPRADNDDGDLMIEKVTSEGVWEAMINSINIPDGMVELHYVAFDKAGNCKVGTPVSAKVTNNAPKIAGAKIWIDYNGNGKFDEANGEITLYNSDNNERAAKALTGSTGTGSNKKNIYDPKPSASEKPAGFNALTESYTIGKADAGAFVMKGKTKIIPEIVGGNGDIYYSYVDSVYAADDTKTKGLNGNNPAAFMTGSTDNTIGKETNPIILQVGDLLKAGDCKKSEPDKITFTFTDSTGSADADHMHATLEIYAGINVKATVKPTVKIRPFYWNSLVENSLYIENRSSYDSESTYEEIFKDTKGHIELEKYWKGGTYGSETITAASGYTGADTGIGDGDPKVSGIIIIEGKAHDDLRIDSLVFTLPGMGVAINGVGHNADTEFTLTSVDSETGLLSGTTWNATKGVGLELTRNEYSETGHDIEWKLTWDTSKIATVAALDVGFAVKAVNIGTPTATPEDAGETDAMDTRSVDGVKKYTYSYGTKVNSTADTYRMDIVPYITYLETSLTKKMTAHPSVYGRTAAGDYPVYYYTTRFDGATAANLKGENYKYVGFNIPANTTKNITDSTNSGEDSVTVNTSIVSINNMNNNNAPYNKQPNGINNNNLNDDVRIKVWKINSKAATSSKGALSEPKMHSNGGTLGYAYIHNGGMTYQLNEDYSNEAISTYANIDFIFDRSGNKLGVYCGTNYNGTDVAGRMKFINSTWITTDKNGNRVRIDKDEARNNTIDLESMAYWNEAGTDTVSAPKRFAAPKLASSTNSNKNNVYMLYYDTIKGKLKFRAGQTYAKAGFGNFTNLNTRQYETVGTETRIINNNGVFTKTTDNKSNVEWDPWNNAKVIKNGGADISATYYSLAVVSGSATDGKDDKVVAAWVSGGKLYYAYCTNPLDDSPAWTILEVEKLSGYADGVCAIAADPNGQIHIAAYSSVATGSLTYTYLKSYNAFSNKVPSANTVYVDRYGTTGEFLTIDFAVNASGGNYVPYIGYYANEMPKYAYMTGDGNKSKTNNWLPPAGVTGASGEGDGNFYTGDWEQVILPTISSMNVNANNNNVNIALTRTSATNGVKKATNGPANTVNPVLGYSISYQGIGYLETAQLK